MVSYRNKNIIYTFKYGGYISKNVKITLIIIPSILMLLSLIIFIIMMLNNEEGAWASLILFFIGLIVLIPILCSLFKISRNDKEILTWLNDENLIEANAMPWEYSRKSIGLGIYYRFGVEFNLNGDAYKAISSGYDAFYKHIKDIPIHILYSPKYEQVMILKD